MKFYAITLFALLAWNTASAAPTHHEIADAMITLMNANNMADGNPAFKVCFEDAGEFIADDLLDSRIMYKVSVIRSGNENGSTDKVVYSVVTGSYWTLQSISRLGQESDVEFKCPDNTVIEYKPSI